MSGVAIPPTGSRENAPAAAGAFLTRAGIEVVVLACGAELSIIELWMLFSRQVEMNRSLIPEPFMRQAGFLITAGGQIAPRSLRGVMH